MRNYYNYSHYWQKRGINYFLDFKASGNFINQEKILIKVLRKIKFKTVFEIGAGFGRITKIILDNFDIKKYLALDISDHQIQNLKKYVGKRKYQLYHKTADFLEYEPTSFPCKNYDLVIAVETLMHIPPTKIDLFVNKMINLSRKHVLNIDFSLNEKIELRSYNFAHNYDSIYSGYRLDYSKLFFNKSQALFCIQKN